MLLVLKSFLHYSSIKLFDLSDMIETSNFLNVEGSEVLHVVYNFIFLNENCLE